MKKFLLVVITLMPMLLTAQNGIVISNFSVSGGEITLDLSWKKVGMPTLWLDSAWVFVDYNNAGVMERLPLAAGATLTATSAPGVGKVITVPGNTDGVWVVGNAKNIASGGSFSATVKLPFSGSNVSGACAYASNYPPLGTWNTDMNRLTIVGTPPYTLTLQLKSSAATETVISGSPYILSPDYTLVSFTDKTGAPGLFNCTPPTAPESLTASSATICDGTSVSLTATGGSDGSGAQFEWGTGTVGVGGTLTSSNTYLVSPTATTTYWIRRVSTDNCGTSTAITRTVTVITKPSVPTPTIGGNTCVGTGITFSAITPGGATGVEWTGAVTGTGSPKTTATTAGTYSAQVRSYLTVGTLTCASAYSTATSGSVVAAPSVPTPSVGGNTCVGTGITFSATTPGGATGVEWTGAVTGTGSPKTTATTAGTYSAQVRSYLTVGTLTCTSAYSTATSGSVVAAPSVPTPTIGGNTCAGTGLTFSATTPGGATGVEWTGAVTGTGSPKTTATTAGTYSAQVRSYLTVGTLTCTSAYSTATSGTIAAFPTINTQPVAATVCYNTGTNLSVTATANAGALTYQWYKNSVSMSTSGQVATVATGNLTATTPFYVVVGNTAGCSVTSNTENVTVRTAFTAGAIATTGQTITSGATVTTITSTTAASGGDGSITYKWQRNSTDISSATAATYSPAEFASTTGTHTFTRWAHDGTCNTAWTQSSGSWVLTVQAAATCNPSTGVDIGGVCWAKTNVDAPGVFATAPDQPGKFYKWYEATPYAISGTDNTYNTNYASGATASSTWTNSSPPCPSGWRVPKTTEITALINAGYAWRSSGFAIQGMVFGPNFNNCVSLQTLTGECIFIPAPGQRDASTGVADLNVYGSCWSADATSSTKSNFLAFRNWNSAVIDASYGTKSRGFSVRCVK